MAAHFSACIQPKNTPSLAGNWRTESNPLMPTFMQRVVASKILRSSPIPFDDLQLASEATWPYSYLCFLYCLLFIWIDTAQAQDSVHSGLVPISYVCRMRHCC